MGNLTWQDANSSQSTQDGTQSSAESAEEPVYPTETKIWGSWQLKREVCGTLGHVIGGAHDITSGKYKASELPSEEGQCYHETQLRFATTRIKRGSLNNTYLVVGQNTSKIGHRSWPRNPQLLKKSIWISPISIKGKRKPDHRNCEISPGAGQSLTENWNRKTSEVTCRW